MIFVYVQGRLVCRIRAEGVGWSGTVWNTLKGGGAEKKGEETKVFKRRWGKLGQGVGALKGSGTGNPLEAMTP